MDDYTVAVLRRGIESALLASIPQVLIPKPEEHLLLSGGASARPVFNSVTHRSGESFTLSSRRSSTSSRVSEASAWRPSSI